MVRTVPIKTGLLAPGLPTSRDGNAELAASKTLRIKRGSTCFTSSLTSEPGCTGRSSEVANLCPLTSRLRSHWAFVQKQAHL